MIWVRGPLWDGFWLLSGIPLVLLGVGLVIGLHLPVYALLVVGVVVLQTGHSIAPVALAWSHPGFRQRVLLKRPIRFLIIPGCLLVGLTLGGWFSGRYWPGALINPVTWAYSPSRQMPWVMAVVTVHSLWNWWHFGRQNFGVMSIYRRKSCRPLWARCQLYRRLLRSRALRRDRSNFANGLGDVCRGFSQGRLRQPCCWFRWTRRPGCQNPQ